MRPLSVTALTLMVLLSGCLGPAPAPPSPQVVHPVVVALVDSGVNPYHRDFRTEWMSVPPTLNGLDLEILNITFGTTWENSVDADGALWERVETGRLYWFRGTRVLAISFSSPNLPPLLDGVPGHGTGTASAVLLGNPEAIIVMVTASSERREGVQLPFDPTRVRDAIAWATSQPWVDVISLSLGIPAGAPLTEWEQIPSMTRSATSRGAIVLGSSGNDGTPSIEGQVSGPPWVIRVGGGTNTSQGQTSLASRAVDFLGNFRYQGPCSDHVEEYCDYLGTSFATPLVAGAFARAVHDLREATRQGAGIVDGALVNGNSLRVTNMELRDAFNRTAAYWNTTDYSPDVPPPEPSLTLPAYLNAPYYLTTPIGPAPWAQMGWGYVGPELGPEVARLLLASATLPEKPAEAVAYMNALDEARHAYWDGRASGTG